MMMPSNITGYLNNLAPSPIPVLHEMESYAEDLKFPIIGPLVGRLLYILIEFGHVHTILECGSGFGYSAVWMAMALPENGQIICIDNEEQNIELARGYLEQAGFLHKVSFIRGDATEEVKKMRKSFDLIFNDIDKTGYPLILPALIERLRVGGLLLTDNVLWKGKVTEQQMDEATEAIDQMNQMLNDIPHMVTSILPLQDGVSLSIKLRNPEDDY